MQKDKKILKNSNLENNFFPSLKRKMLTYFQQNSAEDPNGEYTLKVNRRCKFVPGRSVCVSIRNSVSDGMLNVDDDIRRFQKCSLRLNLPAIPVSTEKRTRGNHISNQLLPNLDSFGSNSKYNL